MNPNNLTRQCLFPSRVFLATNQLLFLKLPHLPLCNQQPKITLPLCLASQVSFSSLSQPRKNISPHRKASLSVFFPQAIISKSLYNRLKNLSPHQKASLSVSCPLSYRISQKNSLKKKKKSPSSLFGFLSKLPKKKKISPNRIRPPSLDRQNALPDDQSSSDTWLYDIWTPGKTKRHRIYPKWVYKYMS